MEKEPLVRRWETDNGRRVVPRASPPAAARRTFLGSLVAGVSGALPSEGAAPVMGATPISEPIRIRRIRCYMPPRPRPLVSQSNAIVTVETDQGITGIGEGGSADTVKALAGLLIGEDASRIEHLWQLMYRGHFYPPGREKLHALGALDLALWDIRGKALGRPLHELFGGLTRDHVDCYSTAFPARGTLRETARACIEAGFRAFRIGVADPDPGQPFEASAMVRKSYEQCREVHEGVGAGGEWAIDYHTRLDQADAVRLSTLIEELEPFFAEDLVRSEDPGVYRALRQQVKVPIAVGEQFGDRWDISELVEQHLIDYSRVTIPNVGGLTEFRKLASLCELHYVGLVPHFTGPVASAALIHALASVPAPVAMEILGTGPETEPHLPQSFDFHEGKAWPNSRPGLGVEFEPSRAALVTEVSEPVRPVPIFRRPDGSLTNW